MKICIPVWEGKVSPVFDTASRLLILQVEEERELSRFETYMKERALTRRCTRMRLLGIDTLICGAISSCFCSMLTASGITVIPWRCGPAKEVLDAYMKGTVLHPRFSMPGCHKPDGEKRCERTLRKVRGKTGVAET